MSSFNKTALVNSDPEKLWLIISDIRGMADLYTFMHISDYRQEGSQFFYTRKLDIPGLASLCWQESAIIENKTMSFQAISGDLTKFTGYWQVEPFNEGSNIKLVIEYDIPTGIGPNVPKFMAETVLGQIFQKIIETIKAKAENNK